MKIWTKPTISALNNGAIKSGTFTDGGESFSTCSGAVVPASTGSQGCFSAAAVCASQNPTGTFACTGIPFYYFPTPAICWTTGANSIVIPFNCS